MRVLVLLVALCVVLMGCDPGTNRPAEPEKAVQPETGNEAPAPAAEPDPGKPAPPTPPPAPPDEGDG